MTTRPITLTVNGEAVTARVEPRMHLGDFVRRELGLTGTHLSCEHGVCGACTVLVDGVPQRSCITFAVACEGSAVTTVEGYDDDAVMGALRQSFHEHHALQCGYCTPGMLCTGRDIVLRLPGPDARRVRHELAGNLCRCTGYVGIVEAIQHVLVQKAAGTLAMPATAAEPVPVAASVGSAEPVVVMASPVTAAMASATGALPPTDSNWPPLDMARDGDWVQVPQQLTLPLDARQAWQQLADLPRVANCLPGATMTRASGNRAQGEMAIQFGPITAKFVMRAEMDLDAANRRGTLRAEGVDQRSATRVKTLLDYQVNPVDDHHCRVEVMLRFRLAGPLAQFSRTGLVNDYVAELTRRFGQNIGRTAAGDTTASPMAAPSLFAILLARIRRWFGG